MKEHRSKILIVDDETANIDILLDILGDRYTVIVAKEGRQAIKRCFSTAIPDLILLDIMMPGMNGYQVCKYLKANQVTRSIPVIFVTGMDDPECEREGLELGAVDYITKPFSPSIVRARVMNHLFIKETTALVEKQNEVLEEMVFERTRELALTQDVAIFSLASLAGTRDKETGNHIRRTQYYVQILATKLNRNPKFNSFLNQKNIHLMFKSAALHDIGKVGIPDRILLKPDRLTADEYAIMKQHTTLGCDAILQGERELGTTSFLRFAREIAASHHERWDGSGYPERLRGKDIPLSGRLMALADVYDALISRRVYKPAFSHSRATEIIIAEKGAHFDPDVTDAFIASAEEFCQVAREFADY